MAVRWALGCSVFSGRTLCVWLALLTVWRGPRQTGELCTGGEGGGCFSLRDPWEEDTRCPQAMEGR